MLAHRVVRASTLRAASRNLPVFAQQQRSFIPSQLNDKEVYESKYPDPPKLTEAEDPNQNGGYINPPPIKRQFRDPHADWWDKQERRNFGEPVHEDNDLMGIFSPHEYTWVKPKVAFFQLGVFITVFCGVLYVVKALYPDRKAFPREFEGGLERELGGPGAVRARSPDDPEPYQIEEVEE
ncbi:NADH:ubiquinone oxidoreductase subunit [Xylariaceae sp. FL0255]|nr:NADH:ubiquinone oxidoreductase subunit [Xylariaceae sp. FL0255]